MSAETMLAQREGQPVEALIRRTPGVHGGDACVGSHRIPVWVLEALRRLGADDERVLKGYPTVTREELAAAWEYVAEHEAEIDALIEANEAV